MKYFASLCALVLAGSMPGFAVSAHNTGINPENQFHFKPTGRRAAQLAARDAKFAAQNASANQTHNLSQPAGPASKMAPRSAQAQPASAKNVHRHTANPPIGKTGLLAATQIPAGDPPTGALTYWAALSGDFNGDGKTDIVSEVESYNGTTWVYSISVVLSNGDGTFQSPVLTNITDTCAALLVADVDGDGKSDLILGHTPNNCGNTNTNPTFDVWLSKGDGTFTPTANPNNTILTTGIAGGTIADVNGDGKLDLVLVDDNNPANVFTLLGNGDGTFLAPTSVALSGEVGYNVVVADLSGHGNGLLDIADNDYSTNQLTVYLATSATTYGLPATYLTPDSKYNACALAAGDLNGKPALVNTNCSNLGNDITVYVNNGGGIFGDSTGTGVYYNGAMSGGTNSEAAPVATQSVSFADVNGDGKVDIIATNYYSGDVTILLGNGDGTVNVPNMGYAVGGYPYAPTIVADFNGDGFADIVVPDEVYSFVYMKGYGDGTFHAARTSYAGVTGYSSSYDLATGDFNKDGHTDVVVANYCSGCTAPVGITVFLSNPDGSLQPGVSFGASSYYFVAVSDFNGDGNLDIAATDYNNGVVQLFNGDGTGNFTVGTAFNTDLTSNYPVSLYVGDFNNDGHPDLAIENGNTGTSTYDIAILLNDGSGNFPTPMPTSISGYAWQGAAVADINGDGKVDLVFPYTGGTSVGVLLGKGDGTFQPEQDITLSSPEAVTIADFNGDGKLDMAVATIQGGGHDIAIALGNGDGTFGSFTTVAGSLQDFTQHGSPYPQFIQTTDVDGDGKADLVYTNSSYGTVGILFGKGDGTFYDPVEYPAGGYYVWSLAVGDFNGDGTPDVVTSAEEYSAEATVLLNNNGAGTLGSYTIGTSAQGATITAGQTATFTLTITPNNHYNGTVTLSCPTNLPALVTCSLSSSSVTLDGLNPQTVTLTITTKAASSSLRNRASVDQQSTPRSRNSAMLLASLNGMGVFGMFLAGGSSKKRTRWSLLAVLALAMSFFLVGCGGSSSGNNNNNNPPPTKSNSTSAVTSSAATTLVGQAVTFTGTVSASSGTPTGTVTFLDGKTTLGTGTLSSGKATFQTSSLAAGVHNITMAYGGDSNYNTSTSTAYSQTVDNPGTASGTYTVTVSGTGTAGTNGVGSPNQSVGLTVIVQ